MAVRELVTVWLIINVQKFLRSCSVKPFPSATEHSVLRTGKKIPVPLGIGVEHVRTSPVCPPVPPVVVTSPAVPNKKNRLPGCNPIPHEAPVVSVNGFITLDMSREKAKFHHFSPRLASALLLCGNA
jgi:hypothetical protein